MEGLLGDHNSLQSHWSAGSQAWRDRAAWGIPVQTGQWTVMAGTRRHRGLWEPVTVSAHPAQAQPLAHLSHPILGTALGARGIVISVLVGSRVTPTFFFR